MPFGGAIGFDEQSGLLLSAVGPNRGRFATLSAWLAPSSVHPAAELDEGPQWSIEIETFADPADVWRNDGAMLAIGGARVAACPRWQSTPIVVDVATGNVLHRIAPEGLSERFIRLKVAALALSHDGKCLAQALRVPQGDGYAWRIEVMDIASRTVQTAQYIMDDGRSVKVWALAFSPDNAKLMVAGQVNSAQWVWLLNGADPPRPVWQGSATAPMIGGTAQALWQPSAPRVLFNHTPHALALTSDGQIVLTASPDGVLAWPIDSRRAPAPAAPARSAITLEWLLHGRPTVQAWQKVCRLLDERDNDAGESLIAKATRWPARIRQMPDHWWDARRDGRSLAHHAVAACRIVAAGDCADVTAIACTRDANALLVCRALEPHVAGGAIDLWCNGDLTPLVSENDYYGEATTATFSADGTLVAVAGTLQGEAFVSVYDVETGLRQRMHTEAGADLSPTCLAFSRDGRLLAYNMRGTDRVMVWPMAADSGPASFGLPRPGAGAAAFDPDGRRLAASTHDGLIRIWQLDTGRLLSQYHSGVSDPCALVFAPDGAELAVLGSCLSTRPDEVAVPLPYGGKDLHRANMVWTSEGLRAYWSGDGMAAVVEGHGAQPLWASATILNEGWTAGCLSPSGRLLITAEEDITIWFLDR